MQITIYQNKDYVLVRKPHGIPSTFGKEKCLLDYIKENISESMFTQAPLSALLPPELVKIASGLLCDWESSDDVDKILHHQVDVFGQDQEYGLLNRLDNDTAGFLYFAKDPKAFSAFKSIQKTEKIHKYYLAQVEGKIGPIGEKLVLQKPIMHHKSNAEKMVVIESSKDDRLGRGKPHHVSTEIDILHYSPEIDVTTILVAITRGIRHQIRAHLANMGHPIVGDILYGKNKSPFLHLWSMGFIEA